MCIPRDQRTMLEELEDVNARERDGKGYSMVDDFDDVQNSVDVIDELLQKNSIHDAEQVVLNLRNIIDTCMDIERRVTRHAYGVDAGDCMTDHGNDENSIAHGV